MKTEDFTPELTRFRHGWITIFCASQNNRYIAKYPDTDARLCDWQIPHWHTILDMAAKLWEKTEFGYLGIDVILDKEKGRLLLEINARRGLSIQIANQQGLIPRLEIIDSNVKKLSGIEQKIAFAREKFAIDS
ncbi:MAG: sugar-transfer associated ATP-grasp domain-containing protein [Rivularia sp. (in: cyanobacteria)]